MKQGNWVILNDKSICDPTQPSKYPANDENLNLDDEEGLNVDEDIKDFALL